MSQTGRILIIPAAGLGTRLKSELPKVLVPVDGAPMLDRLLDMYKPFVDRFIVITHPSFDPLVRQHVEASPLRIDIAVQAVPSGMLDAALLGHAIVAASDARRVWMTWCDQLAIHPETLRRLTTLSDELPDAAIVLPTCRRRDPYIHFVRAADGRIDRVLQRREGDVLPELGESDAGLFSLSRSAYLDELRLFAARADAGGATGERNFLPFIPWAAARGRVVTFPCVEEWEAIGINTPEELGAIQAHLRARRSAT
jgi:bifunctional UDP-N-acetylglucosamine pyrophosphorylase/glucosamine-1-phosphate N-acetyltransferase